MPLHFSPDWLDGVCLKGGWNANVILNNNEELEAVQVYHWRNYMGFKFILMPMMTSYSGIYFHYPDGIKNHSRISFEQRLITELFKKLPKHDFYYQQYHPQFKNWMPLYWKGYSQSTRYTYRVNLSEGEEKIWSRLKSTVRTNIRKAENNFLVKEIGFDEFWKELDDSCKGRNKVNPFRREVLSNIYESLSGSKMCKLHVAVDKTTHQAEAGIMLVYDESTCYYICGFFHEQSKQKHPFSLLLWDRIKRENKDIFDFEGSMIKEIESFFRTFGGELIPHFKIWKVHNPLLKLIFKIKKPDFLG